MANASKIVSDYQQALGKGDFASARKLVHDDLLFQGPLDTFHSPEPYFDALKKLHPIIQRIDLKKIFADGNDVCVLYARSVSQAPFSCEKSCGGLSILHFSNVLNLVGRGSRGAG